MKVPPLAETLSAAGFLVLPLRENRKGIYESWGAIAKRGPDACRAALLTARGLTGAAVTLAPTDPVPIIILDVDDHTGRPAPQVWGALCPSGDPLPESAGVVRSASGGLHFWFRLPDDINAKHLPAHGVDFGNGLRGDLFHSRGPRSLLVLPGSQALTKKGKLGRYIEEQAIVPDDLPYPPDAILKRILARRSAPPARKKDSLPSEVLHFLRLLADGKPQFKEGNLNNVCAQVGEICGRIAPQPVPTTPIEQQVFDALAPCLQSPPFDPADPKKVLEVRQAISRGWKTGQANKKKHDLRDANPTVTDVLAECDAIFGGHPWLQELRRSDGKVAETVLGVGGTAKSPHNAFATGQISAIGDALPALAAISGADPDSVVTSPFQIQPSWRKALEFHLLSSKAVIYLGSPPEDRLLDQLRGIAEAVARKAGFQVRLGDRRKDAGAAFIFWPAGEDDKAALIIPDHAEHEYLLSASGDITRAKAFVAQKVTVKRISSRNKPVWSVPLRLLGPEAVKALGAAYEKALAARAEA